MRLLIFQPEFIMAKNIYYYLKINYYVDYSNNKCYYTAKYINNELELYIPTKIHDHADTTREAMTIIKLRRSGKVCIK